jgi:kinesin family member 11
MNDTQNIKGTNVQVAVRCRPVNADERKSGQPSVVTCNAENKTVQIATGPTGKKSMKNFTFDKVFGMYSRQEEVFDSMVRPIVDEVLEGFNCTIFAYGQTGTGKTHTMEGNIHSEEDAGIVPRSVKAILENLESCGSEFTIRVSFLELCKNPYSTTKYPLLAPLIIYVPFLHVYRQRRIAGLAKHFW